MAAALERLPGSAVVPAGAGAGSVAPGDLVALLGAVAVAANEASDGAGALARALEHLCRVTGWPVGHAYETGDDGTLRPLAVWHLEGDAAGLSVFRRASDSTPMPEGVGLPGRVLRSGRPAWIADVARDTNFPRAAAAREAGLRAAFALPVLAAPGVVAVLELFSRTKVEPDAGFLEAIGHVGRQLGLAFDRHRAQRALQESELRTRRILDTAGDAFIGMDAGGLINAWNEQAEQIFGWPREEAIGRSVADTLVPSEYREAHEAGLARFLASGETRVLGQHLELAARHRSGEQFPIDLTLWALPSQGGWDFYAFARDITDRKAAEEELAHRALHDELTGLANRALLLDRIEQALGRNRRSPTSTAVLFIDLDRFKVVNDSLGHDVGDSLLNVVAERLRGAVRPSDTVGRLAGDEFLVICEDVEDVTDATRVAQRVQDALGEAVDLDGRSLRVSASIGVALAGDGGDAEGLLRDADVAMYRAKESGRGRLEVADETMRERALNQLRTERELEEAIATGQLRLHYQPIVSLADGSISGVEALVRWQHPRRGLLAPADFISLAEESGLIVPLGSWVLQEACRQARAWDGRGVHGLRVSVNLSGHQLGKPDFDKTVAAIVREAELDPRRVELCLEVTESLLMVDPPAAASRLSDLRALGVSIAIDDFGTGYSSLAYLKWFPVDVVKVDRSFVSDIVSDDADRAIVDAVVGLAHALGMQVVAEGVERPEQLRRLRDAGCDQAQGFLFARPQPAGSLVEMLGRGRVDL
ncbi:MAG: putative bifunctional diguanylate cyclase/phosphodiesterase [Acidimicrobiales bacterium]